MSEPPTSTSPPSPPPSPPPGAAADRPVPADLDDWLSEVARGDAACAAAAQERFTALATPPGALGDVERLGVRLAAIAGTDPPPRIVRPVLILAAGDHGVHAMNVSPWPQEVTALMVRTAAQQRSTADAFAAAVGAEVALLDVGVATPSEAHPRVRRRAVRAGTRDLSVEPAMTADECVAAVRAGAELAGSLVDDGADVLLTGEMGIANTTAAAALLALTTGGDPTEVTGRGTGIDDPTLERKVAAVEAAVDRHRGQEPLAQLAGAGGAEHAALVGVILAGATRRVPVVLDGVSTVAAACVAAALAPQVVDHLIAGHRSPEPGATAGLDHLGLTPLLDLQLRLGEGTGGLLAVPLLRAAVAALHDVATLDEVLSEGG